MVVKKVTYVNSLKRSLYKFQKLFLLIEKPYLKKKRSKTLHKRLFEILQSHHITFFYSSYFVKAQKLGDVPWKRLKEINK